MELTAVSRFTDDGDLSKYPRQQNNQYTSWCSGVQTPFSAYTQCFETTLV